MKKLFKKSISCIVAVFMVLSSMPFTALTANAALVKQDIAVWDAANVTAATPGSGTKFTHTDSSTNVSINGVHWGSASKANGNGYVTFNNATISSEAGFASLNIKGDVWTFSSKFAATGSGKDDQNTQQTTNPNSTIFGIGTATTRNYSPSGAAKTTGMAADLVNITKNGNIYLAGSSTSSGTVANVLSTSADDAKTLTVAYDNGNLTISLDGTTAYTGTVDTALFSQGVSNFFIGTSAQVYAGGTAPYYGLTNDGYYTYGTHLYSLSASVSVDLSSQIDAVKTSIDNTGFSAKTGNNQVVYFGNQTTGMATGVTGVLYSNNAQNAYSDCSWHDWNMNGNSNTTMQAKVMAVTNRIVYLYSGDKSVIKVPVMAEFAMSGSTVKRFHVNYIATNTSDWVINQNWTAPNHWYSWDTNTSSTEDGLYVVSYDPNHNVTDFSSNSGGATGNWNLKNIVSYNGSLSFDENNSMTLTNPRFKNSVDIYATWAFGGKGAYSNVGHNNVALGDQKTPIYKVFNYVPMVEKLAAAQTKYNQVKANESNYTPASVLNFYNAVKGLVDYNPNNYDFSTDNAFATATAAMNTAIANYDNAVLVDAVKTYTVTFEDAFLNQTTVKVREGATVPSEQFPTLAKTTQQSNKTQHRRYFFKNTDDGTEFTPATVVTSNIRVIESSALENCSGGEATCSSLAVCDVCNSTYGSLAAHSLVKTEANNATCTEAGNSAYWTCSDCGKMFLDAEATTEITDIPTITATGHSLSKVEEVKSTCTVKGTAAYWTCSACNKMFSDEQGTNEISAPIELQLADHSYTTYTQTLDPTCTTVGKEESACDYGCGTKDVRDVAINENAHNYGAWVDDNNGTSHTRTCLNNSEHTQTEVHNIVNGACTECGYVAFDMAAYNDAVAEYGEIIGAGDYAEKYTEASRTAYQKAVTDAKKNSFASQEEVDAAANAILSAKTKLVYAKADVKVYIAREGVNPELVYTISKNYGETADINVAANLSAGEYIAKWVIETQNKKVNTKLATTDTTVSMVVTEPADVYVHVAKEVATESVQYSKVSFISKNGAVSFVKYVPAGTTLYTNTVDGVEIPFYKFVKWNKDSVVANGSDIEVKAVYEFVGTVENKCRVHYVGFDGGVKEYTYDSFVYLFGAEDKTLALSTDGTEANIITYLNENAFYAPHTADIYVITVATQQASIGITGSYSTSTDTQTTYAFNCKLYVPAGCTVVEYGLIGTAGGVSKKIKAEKASDRGEFTIKITASGLSSMSGKAYLTYKTSSGELKTIYSTTVTQA